MSDQRLRELERRAQAGDANAAAQLDRERQRTGQGPAFLPMDELIAELGNDTSWETWTIRSVIPRHTRRANTPYVFIEAVNEVGTQRSYVIPGIFIARELPRWIAQALQNDVPFNTNYWFRYLGLMPGCAVRVRIHAMLNTSGKPCPKVTPWPTNRDLPYGAERVTS